MNGFDVWVCDNCHLYFSKDVPQREVRVQQRSERIYGTDILSRPIERLVVCPTCWAKFGGGKS